MKIVVTVFILLLSSSCALAEYMSDATFRRRVTSTQHSSERESAMSAYIDQHAGIFSSGIGRKIRTQMLWLSQIDFYAAAQGVIRSRLPANRRAEVAAGLPTDIKAAMHLWWNWYIEDYRAQMLPQPRRVPYPAGLPAPGHPLGQGPAHTLAAATPHWKPSDNKPGQYEILPTDDCEKILWKVHHSGGPPPGSLVVSSWGGKTCREQKWLLLFDCATKSFTVYDGEGFRRNEKPGNYRLCDPGPYAVCTACNGRASSKGSAWVQDTAFHQTNFNVTTSDPNARKKIDTYNVCSTCNGVGYLRQ